MSKKTTKKHGMPSNRETAPKPEKSGSKKKAFNIYADADFLKQQTKEFNEKSGLNLSVSELVELLFKTIKYKEYEA